MRVFKSLSQPLNYPSPYEYAAMSHAAYEDGGPLKDKDVASSWEVVHWRILNDDCYYGVAYKSETLKHIVIAHRGSLYNAQNFIDDIRLVWLGQLPKCHKSAKEFSKSVRDCYGESYTYSETGHSLGGMLAILNGHTFGSKVTSFDSPGMGHLLRDKTIRESLRKNPLVEENYVNYVSAPNSINTAGEPMGIWIRIFPYHSHSEGVFTAESFSDLVGMIDFITKAKKIVCFIDCLRLFIGNFTLIYKIFMSADMRLHSIENILKVFHPSVGEPLQARVKSWSTSSDYWGWWWTWYTRNLMKLKDKPKPLAWNKICEQELDKLDGYKLGDFFIPKIFLLEPPLGQLGEQLLNQYLENLLNEYAHFFVGKKSDKFKQSLLESNFPKVVIAKYKTDNYPVMIRRDANDSVTIKNIPSQDAFSSTEIYEIHDKFRELAELKRKVFENSPIAIALMFGCTGSAIIFWGGILIKTWAMPAWGIMSAWAAFASMCAGSIKAQDKALIKLDKKGEFKSMSDLDLKLEQILEDYKHAVVRKNDLNWENKFNEDKRINTLFDENTIMPKKEVIKIKSESHEEKISSPTQNIVEIKITLPQKRLPHRSIKSFITFTLIASLLPIANRFEYTNDNILLILKATLTLCPIIILLRWVRLQKRHDQPNRCY